jgi:hypothetical protein
MTVLPTLPAAPAVGDTGIGAWADQVQACLAFFMAPPSCQVWGNTAQSFTTAVAAAVLWDQETIDTAGMHSTVTNTSQITAVYPGKYLITAQATFVANATGVRQGQLNLNGVLINGSTVDEPGSAAGGTTVTCVFEVALAVGDFVEYVVQQTSGGALALVAGRSAMTAVWCGS